MTAYTYNGKKNSCGAKIREVRMKCGMTQEELAARLQLLGMDVDQKVISRIELQDRAIYDFELWAISQVLQVKIEELMQELPDSTPLKNAEKNIQKETK